MNTVPYDVTVIYDGWSICLSNYVAFGNSQQSADYISASSPSRVSMSQMRMSRRTVRGSLRLELQSADFL